MPGPPPKNPKTRQRRNKTTTRATLPPAVAGTVAALPPAELYPLPPRVEQWHEMTRLWWADVWKSEMRDEFLRIDVHRLYMLAVLVDQFWCAPSADAHKEVRLAGQCFGSTPLDRRRLQWEVKRAPEDMLRRPAAGEMPKLRAAAADPRGVLSMVAKK